jgi:hypothetical protein
MGNDGQGKAEGPRHDTERTHRTSPDKHRQARPIGTSGALIGRSAGCAHVCALGGSLDIAVADGESDATREIETEEGKGERRLGLVQIR